LTLHATGVFRQRSTTAMPREQFYAAKDRAGKRRTVVHKQGS
jgi:hypothetical protein